MQSRKFKDGLRNETFSDVFDAGQSDVFCFLRGESCSCFRFIASGRQLFAKFNNVGSGGVSAGGEAKALSLIYTDAAVKGYRLFNIDESFDDVTNLYDINQHPNEVMTVDPVLYDALKKVSDANCREIYLGPPPVHQV